MNLDEVKVTDLKKTRQLVSQGGFRAWNAYKSAYLFSKNRQGAVMFHVIMLTGIIGYSLEYSHLSKFYYLHGVNVIVIF